MAGHSSSSQYQNCFSSDHVESRPNGLSLLFVVTMSITACEKVVSCRINPSSWVPAMSPFTNTTGLSCFLLSAYHYLKYIIINLSGKMIMSTEERDVVGNVDERSRLLNALRGQFVRIPDIRALFSDWPGTYVDEISPHLQLLDEEVTQRLIGYATNPSLQETRVAY